MVITLSACGGGSSSSDVTLTVDDTPVTLTSNNAVKALAVVLSATLGEASNVSALGSDMVTGISQKNAAGFMGLINLARTQLELSSSENSSVESSLLTGLVLQKTINCADGGYYISSFDDRNNDDTFSSGEVDNRVFYGCRNMQNALPLSGSVKIDLYSKNTNTLSSSTDAQLGIIFSNFTQGSKSINGVTTLYLRESSNNDVLAKVYGEELVFSNVSGTTRLKNYEQTLNITNSTGIYTFVLYGEVANTSLGGSVNFSTSADAPLLGDKDNSPDNLVDGELIIQGANNSEVRVLPIDPNSVKISVDASGDGVYEYSTIKSWAEISEEI